VVGVGLKNSEDVGCRYIAVDAYPQQEIVRFYQKNNLKILKEEKRTITMYKDIIEKTR